MVNSLISHAEGSNTTGQQDVTCNVPAPGGANPTGVGDLLIGIWTGNSGTSTWTEQTTADWTSRATQSSIATTIFEVVDTGSLASSYTFRRSNSVGVALCTILRFPAGSTLYEEDAVSAIAGSGGALTHDSLTLPSDGEYYQWNARVVGGASVWTPPGSGGGTPGNPDILYSAAVGGSTSLGIETGVAGATGTRAWTYTNSSASRGANFMIVPPAPAVNPSAAFLNLI